jgi:hypothetical protein
MLLRTQRIETKHAFVVEYARPAAKDVSLMHAYARGFVLPFKLRVQFHQPEQPRMTGEDVTQ